jgi:hypothetical protein
MKSERNDMSAKQIARVGVRSFSEILIDLASGDVEKRLTNDLAELVRAVEETGDKGKLTLTLDVSKGAKLVSVTAKVESKLPRAPLENTSFFTDERGGLHVENPRQAKFPFGAPQDDGGAS